ncbi:hypothetical protein [Neobacillus terrae]|uniref:hypothetical protein n=1 Tax=Neobacillus terrae TaxID=3034837 RepID=UPI001407620B|nr:hypothetical protein [Neobacillus terrae]NHM31073.1 hypothetical protein [Neobacillus terrae]
MLTFEEKLTIIESFTELNRKDVSLKRVNFQYEESNSDKKNIVYHLHPNGNGFVYAGNLEGYETDEKGMVNIRDFTAEELRNLLRKTIHSLSPENKEQQGEQKEIIAVEELWRDDEDNLLKLKFENELWNLYFGVNIETTFGTYEEAALYLQEEGLKKI